MIKQRDSLESLYLNLSEVFWLVYANLWKFPESFIQRYHRNFLGLVV